MIHPLTLISSQTYHHEQPLTKHAATQHSIANMSSSPDGRVIRTPTPRRQISSTLSPLPCRASASRQARSGRAAFVSKRGAVQSQA